MFSISFSIVQSCLLSCFLGTSDCRLSESAASVASVASVVEIGLGWNAAPFEGRCQKLGIRSQQRCRDAFCSQRGGGEQILDATWQSLTNSDTDNSSRMKDRNEQKVREDEDEGHGKHTFGTFCCHSKLKFSKRPLSKIQQTYFKVTSPSTNL